MDRNSTPFLLFDEIETFETDLYADAWGLHFDLEKLFVEFENITPEPDKQLIASIMATI